MPALSVRLRSVTHGYSQLSLSEILFLADDHAQHPITANLSGLDDELILLSSKPGGQVVDCIRGNFFDRPDMRSFPCHGEVTVTMATAALPASSAAPMMDVPLLGPAVYTPVEASIVAPPVPSCISVNVTWPVPFVT